MFYFCISGGGADSYRVLGNCLHHIRVRGTSRHTKQHLLNSSLDTFAQFSLKGTFLCSKLEP
jgi:hypothetical protein